MELKKPISFEEQLNKIKSRNCIVEDENSAIEFLNRVNYYRLTAYFLPFKRSDDMYKTGTSFETVRNIYEFDRKLSNLCFLLISDIEIFVRTQIAYFHSIKYGAVGYLDKHNFCLSKFNNHAKILSSTEIAKEHNKNLPFVSHHNKNYGGVYPLWVIIELFTMGNLSKFYSNMIKADRNFVSKNAFGMPSKVTSSWLQCLTVFRNHCAHYSRLYFYKFSSVPVTPKSFNSTLGNRIYDYIIILKHMYNNPAKWISEFAMPLRVLIEEYEDYINLEHIGFPIDWEKSIGLT